MTSLWIAALLLMFSAHANAVDADSGTCSLAMQLMSSDTKQEIHLQRHGLEKLRLLSGNAVVVIGIIGEARIGKSTTLNGLISDCDSEHPFEASAKGTAGVTKGVHVYTKGNTIYLDIEGLDLDNEAVAGQLSAVAGILASEVALFVTGTVTNKDLIRLKRFTTQVKLLPMGKQGMAGSNSFLPRLHIIVREPLELDHAHVQNFFMGTQEGDNETYNNARREIAQVFGSLHYHTVEHMKYQRHVWVKDITALRKALTTPKRSIAGTHMDGVTLANILEQQLYKHIQDNDSPFENPLRAEEIALCKRHFRNIIKPLMDQTIINEFNQKMPNALEKFLDSCADKEQQAEATQALQSKKKQLIEDENKRIEDEKKRKEVKDRVDAVKAKGLHGQYIFHNAKKGGLLKASIPQNGGDNDRTIWVHQDKNADLGSRHIWEFVPDGENYYIIKNVEFGGALKVWPHDPDGDGDHQMFLNPGNYAPDGRGAWKVEKQDTPGALYKLYNKGRNGVLKCGDNLDGDSPPDYWVYMNQDPAYTEGGKELWELVRPYHDLKVNLVPLLVIEGSSDPNNYVEQKFKHKIGVKNTKYTSQEIVTTVAQEVEAGIADIPDIPVSGSVKNSWEIKSTLFSSNTYEFEESKEVETTFKIFFEKPCYIYSLKAEFKMKGQTITMYSTNWLQTTERLQTEIL